MPAFSEENMIPLSEVKIGQRAQVQGMSADDALNKAKGHYGRFTEADGAVKYIDPRKE